MFKFIASLDRFLSQSRIFWLGFGQLAITLLGVHLAADRLDDHLADLLVKAGGVLADPLLRLGVAELTPEGVGPAAAWVSVGLEGLVLLYLFNSLTLTAQNPELTWNGWRSTLSPHAIALPMLWAPASLAGAWGVAMAVEDAFAPLHAPTASALGPIVGVLVAWRLCWTGWKRVVGGLEPPKRRTQGLLWAPLLIGMGALAFWYGLPIRGLLP